MTTTTTRWTWKDSPELMARILHAQNEPAFAHQDILTIIGFFDSEAELERHVLACEKRTTKLRDEDIMTSTTTTIDRAEVTEHHCAGCGRTLTEQTTRTDDHTGDIVCATCLMDREDFRRDHPHAGRQ